MKHWPRYKGTYLRFISLLAVLVGWEIIGKWSWVDPRYISYPSQVAAGFKELVTGEELFWHLRTSAVVGVIGFLAAIVTGIPLGIALGRFRSLEIVIYPYIMALNSTPRFAFLPLFLLWLGVGVYTKSLIVYLGAFFPLVVNCMVGVRSVEPVLIEAARSFGARERDIFFKVIIPSSVSFIVAGLRLGLGRAILGIVVAEMFIANKGIGFLMVQAGQIFRTDWLFVGVILLILIGLAISESFNIMKRRVTPWL